jgi:hypothetical protein
MVLRVLAYGAKGAVLAGHLQVLTPRVCSTKCLAVYAGLMLCKQPNTERISNARSQTKTQAWRLEGGDGRLGDGEGRQQPHDKGKEAAAAFWCAEEGFRAVPSKKNRLFGSNFLFWEVNYIKLLEMTPFAPHIIFGVGKQHDLGNKKCETIGDAFIEIARRCH